MGVWSRGLQAGGGPRSQRGPTPAPAPTDVGSCPVPPPWSQASCCPSAPRFQVWKRALPQTRPRTVQGPPARPSSGLGVSLPALCLQLGVLLEDQAVVTGLAWGLSGGGQNGCREGFLEEAVVPTMSRSIGGGPRAGTQEGQGTRHAACVAGEERGGGGGGQGSAGQGRRAAQEA